MIFGDCCDGDYGDFVMIAVVVASFPLNDEEWGKLGFFFREIKNQKPKKIFMKFKIRYFNFTIILVFSRFKI